MADTTTTTTTDTTTTTTEVKSIVVKEANVGTKIKWSVTGNIIDFRDEVYINLESRQEDTDTTITISTDYYNKIAIGVSKRRIATIFIPAKTYTQEQVTDATTGAITYKQTAADFDISTCVLTLWSMH